MKFINLSDAELEIMKVFWEKNREFTFAELLEYFQQNTDKDWKKQTLNTFLFRLQQKGYLQAEIVDRYKKYSAIITEETYKLEESKALLDKNYHGSLAKMLASFHGGETLDSEEIAELKTLIEKW